MKCADCVHWGKSRFDYDIEEVFETKICGKAVQLWNAGEFSTEHEFILKEEFKEQMMFTKDGSDYRADLYTKADFFCAHFSGTSSS